MGSGVLSMSLKILRSLRVTKSLLVTDALLALALALLGMMAGGMAAFGHPALFDAYRQAFSVVELPLKILIAFLPLAVWLDRRSLRQRPVRIPRAAS
jgi:hypothetical protein